MNIQNLDLSEDFKRLLILKKITIVFISEYDFTADFSNFFKGN